jgi:hypothetical protein
MLATLQISDQELYDAFDLAYLCGGIKGQEMEKGEQSEEGEDDEDAFKERGSNSNVTLKRRSQVTSATTTTTTCISSNRVHGSGNREINRNSSLSKQGFVGDDEL